MCACIEDLVATKRDTGRREEACMRRALLSAVAILGVGETPADHCQKRVSVFMFGREARRVHLRIQPFSNLGAERCQARVDIEETQAAGTECTSMA